MKIVFFGTPPFVIPILSSLQKNFDVVGIVTAPDRKAGRGHQITPSPIKQYCIEKVDQTRIITPHKWDEETAKQLRTLQPDLFVVAAYGKIIPQKVLDIPVFGALNVHPSLLPKYRGPSPLIHTLLNGDQTTGVCIMKMDEEMDHGPILKEVIQEVHPTETFETLANHLFGIAAELLPEVIKDFTEGRLQPAAQNHKEATYTKLVSKEDGYVDLDTITSEVLDRKIRAYFPWPTAWTMLKIKNKETRVKLLPGKKLQFEGKTPMKMDEACRNYPELTKYKETLLEN